VIGGKTVRYHDSSRKISIQKYHSELLRIVSTLIYGEFFNIPFSSLLLIFLDEKNPWQRM
jgi:hypothetical protein